MRQEPEKTRLGVPFKMKADEEGVLLPWDRASKQLSKATIYWIATTRANGRPLTVPVWGIWRDETIYIRANPYTRTRKNIDRDPRITIHLESGEDAVIFDATAVKIEESPLLESVKKAFDEKYKFPQPVAVFYSARPEVAECQICRGVGESAIEDYRSTGTKYRWLEEEELVEV